MHLTPKGLSLVTVEKKRHWEEELIGLSDPLDVDGVCSGGVWYAEGMRPDRCLGL